MRPRAGVDEDGFFQRYDFNGSRKGSPDLDTYAASQNAVIRLVHQGRRRCSNATANAPYLPPPREDRRRSATATGSSRARSRIGGGVFYVQYARKLSDVKATANRVRVFLGLGVLGGAALALLAGLATATRAMAPITRLTDTARAIARTRDPSLTHPPPRVQRRGLRAGAHAGEHARSRSTRRATRRRRRSRASASSSPTPRTSCARRSPRCWPTSSCSRWSSRASRARPPRPRCAPRAGCAASSPTCCCSPAPTPAASPPHGPVDLSEVRRRGRRRARARRRRPPDQRRRAARRRGRGRARRAAPAHAQPARERAAPHRPGHRGRGDGGAGQRRGRALRRGRRAGHPARAARQGLRALLPRRRRPQRLERPRALDRARRRRSPTPAPCALEEPLDGRGARFVVRFPARG